MLGFHGSIPRNGASVTRPALVLSVLLLALAVAPPARAQEGDRVKAFLEAGVGATRVHGETRALVDLALGLAISPSLSVGGAGHLAPGSADLGEIAFQEVELQWGYGGIFVRMEHPGPTDGSAWHGQILLGAGNGDVEDRTTGLLLDSDNFFVVQPSVGLSRSIRRRFAGSLTLGYRWIAGLEDLRGVRTGDLRAASLHLGLRVTL
jgi:hypothetical protein